METIDEQSGATSGNEVAPYEVIDIGEDDNGASFATSGHNDNGHLSAIYEEASDYQPLKRNPLRISER